MIKNKKAEGVFGMSFSMIFSIILIIFFISAAFIAIKFFMGFGQCAQVGLFVDDFKNKVNGVWQSQSASGYIFNSTLPSGINYVCFVNFSAPAYRAEEWEESVFYEAKRGRAGLLNKNLVFYPSNKACDLGYNRIEHIQIPDTNPYCISVRDSKVSISLERDFGEALVRVG